MNRPQKISGWVVGLLSSFCWLTTGLAQTVPPDSVQHRVILIGDAGRRPVRDPARLLLIMASVAVSQEGALPWVSIGFKF